MNPDADDDPFARKKRSNKTTKRRRRAERGDINADSDDGGEVMPVVVQKAKVKRGTRRSTSSKSRTKPFAVPKDLYEEQKPSNLGKDDDEGRPDYSEAGLRRLRQLTSSKPPDSVPMVIDVDAPNEKNEAQSKKSALEVTKLRRDVRRMSLERKTYKCEACGERFDENDTLQRHLTDAHINAPTPAIGFLQRDRERTEDKLGVLDDMEEFDPQNCGSDAEEWEREQLRRVGLSVSKEPAVVADNLARAVIEEEDLNLLDSLHGEVGQSTLDSFFAGVEEAVRAATHKKSECEVKLSSVRNAILESERKRAVAVETQKKTALRELFYGKLVRFARDVFDMLAEKQDSIENLHKQLVSKFEAEAEKSRNEVEGEKDEFGRTVDPVGILRRRMEEDKDDMNVDEVVDVFADVNKNYKSIPHVCDMFREWREQYPKDYEQAHGDKTVGKICGSIAMAYGEVDLDWIREVPKAARAMALQASRAVELFEVFLRARWDVYSNPWIGRAAEIAKYASEEEKQTLVQAVQWRVECERDLVGRVAKGIGSDDVMLDKANDIIKKRACELLRNGFGVEDPIARLRF